MALKTDYKDYIPPSGGRKYKITANSDGSSSVEDITQYQQVGDTWGAEDINQVNKLVNGAVYPSLLDNSDFTNPVNQRGVSGTISTAGYFIDRWKLVSGTVQITAEGLVLNGTISQILENAAGTDVTASASAGTASYDNSTKTFTLTATGQTITWAKLEKGSVATPYVPKGYGAEMAECQRYYIRIPAWQMIGVGYCDWEGKHVFLMLPTPSTMRINPTVGTLTGTFYFGSGTTASFSYTPGVSTKPGWVVLDFSGTFTQKNQTVTGILSGSTLELSADL